MPTGTERYSVCIRRLERATDNGWYLAFSGDDFQAVVDLIKAIPHELREWDPAAKVWWLDNVALLTLAIDVEAIDVALRDELRGTRSTHTRTRRQEQEPQIPQEVADAFGRLYLLPAAPPGVIRAVYRALSRQEHPDTGGTHTGFVRLSQDHETALAWATTQRAG